MLNLGSKFYTFEELIRKLDEFQRFEKVQLYLSDSQTVTSDAKRSLRKSVNPLLKYSALTYSCVFNGQQLSEKCSNVNLTSFEKCPFNVCLSASDDGRAFIVTKICQNHNHGTMGESSKSNHQLVMQSNAEVDRNAETEAARELIKFSYKAIRKRKSSENSLSPVKKIKDFNDSSCEQPLLGVKNVNQLTKGNIDPVVLLKNIGVKNNDLFEECVNKAGSLPDSSPMTRSFNSIKPNMVDVVSKKLNIFQDLSVIQTSSQELSTITSDLNSDDAKPKIQAKTVAQINLDIEPEIEIDPISKGETNPSIETKGNQDNVICTSNKISNTSFPNATFSFENKESVTNNSTTTDCETNNRVDITKSAKESTSANEVRQSLSQDCDVEPISDKTLDNEDGLRIKIENVFCTNEANFNSNQLFEDSNASLIEGNNVTVRSVSDIYIGKGYPYDMFFFKCHYCLVSFNLEKDFIVHNRSPIHYKATMAERQSKEAEKVSDNSSTRTSSFTRSDNFKSNSRVLHRSKKVDKSFGKNKSLAGLVQRPALIKVSNKLPLHPPLEPVPYIPLNLIKRRIIIIGDLEHKEAYLKEKKARDKAGNSTNATADDMPIMFVPYQVRVKSAETGDFKFIVMYLPHFDTATSSKIMNDCWNIPDNSWIGEVQEPIRSERKFQFNNASCAAMDEIKVKNVVAPASAILSSKSDELCKGTTFSVNENVVFPSKVIPHLNDLVKSPNVISDSSKKYMPHFEKQNRHNKVLYPKSFSTSNTTTVGSSIAEGQLTSKKKRVSWSDQSSKSFLDFETHTPCPIIESTKECFTNTLGLKLSGSDFVSHEVCANDRNLNESLSQHTSKNLSLYIDNLISKNTNITGVIHSDTLPSPQIAGEKSTFMTQVPRDSYLKCQKYLALDKKQTLDASQNLVSAALKADNSINLDKIDPQCNSVHKPLSPLKRSLMSNQVSVIPGSTNINKLISNPSPGTPNSVKIRPSEFQSLKIPVLKLKRIIDRNLYLTKDKINPDILSTGKEQSIVDSLTDCPDNIKSHLSKTVHKTLTEVLSNAKIINDVVIDLSSDVTEQDKSHILSNASCNDQLTLSRNSGPGPMSRKMQKARSELEHKVLLKSNKNNEKCGDLSANADTTGASLINNPVQKPNLVLSRVESEVRLRDDLICNLKINNSSKAVVSKNMSRTVEQQKSTKELSKKGKHDVDLPSKIHIKRDYKGDSISKGSKKYLHCADSEMSLVSSQSLNLLKHLEINAKIISDLLQNSNSAIEEEYENIPNFLSNDEPKKVKERLPSPLPEPCELSYLGTFPTVNKYDSPNSSPPKEKELQDQNPVFLSPSKNNKNKISLIHKVLDEISINSGHSLGDTDNLHNLNTKAKTEENLIRVSPSKIAKPNITSSYNVLDKMTVIGNDAVEDTCLDMIEKLKEKVSRVSPTKTVKRSVSSDDNFSKTMNSKYLARGVNNLQNRFDTRKETVKKIKVSPSLYVKRNITQKDNVSNEVSFCNGDIAENFGDSHCSFNDKNTVKKIIRISPSKTIHFGVNLNDASDGMTTNGEVSVKDFGNLNFSFGSTENTKEKVTKVSPLKSDKQSDTSDHCDLIEKGVPSLALGNKSIPAHNLLDAVRDNSTVTEMDEDNFGSGNFSEDEKFPSMTDGPVEVSNDSTVTAGDEDDFKSISDKEEEIEKLVENDNEIDDVGFVDEENDSINYISLLNNMNYNDINNSAFENPVNKFNYPKEEINNHVKKENAIYAVEDSKVYQADLKQSSNTKLMDNDHNTITPVIQTLDVSSDDSINEVSNSKETTYNRSIKRYNCKTNREMTASNEILESPPKSTLSISSDSASMETVALRLAKSFSETNSLILVSSPQVKRSFGGTILKVRRNSLQQSIIKSSDVIKRSDSMLVKEEALNDRILKASKVIGLKSIKKVVSGNSVKTLNDTLESMGDQKSVKITNNVKESISIHGDIQCFSTPDNSLSEAGSNECKMGSQSIKSSEVMVFSGISKEEPMLRLLPPNVIEIKKKIIQDPKPCAVEVIQANDLQETNDSFSLNNNCKNSLNSNKTCDSLERSDVISSSELNFQSEDLNILKHNSSPTTDEGSMKALVSTVDGDPNKSVKSKCVESSSSSTPQSSPKGVDALNEESLNIFDYRISDYDNEDQKDVKFDNEDYVDKLREYSTPGDNLSLADENEWQENLADLEAEEEDSYSKLLHNMQ